MMAAKKKSKTEPPKPETTEQPKRQANVKSGGLNALVRPNLYRWVFIVVLALTVVSAWFLISDGFRWRSDSAVGTPEPDEIPSARETFLAGFALPAAVLIVTFLVSAFFRRSREEDASERVYRVQAILALALILILCGRFIWNLSDIVFFADYAKADSGATSLRTWDEMHPWQMKLVPRVQELCTSSSWLMAFALSLGLFTQLVRDAKPNETTKEWVDSITK